MSDEQIRDKQVSEYNNFMNCELKQLIEGMSQTVFDKYKVDFRLFPLTAFPIVKNDTKYVTIKTVCTVTDVETSESVQFVVDLLNVPTLEELGFYVKGNYYQVLDMYQPKPGWTFYYKYIKSATVMEKSASVTSTYGKKILFDFSEQQIPFVVFKRDNKSSKISFSTFFRALSGMSNTELLAKFGTSNPYVVSLFSDLRKFMPELEKEEGCIKTNAECIDRLANKMFNSTLYASLKTTTLQLNEINKRLFNPKYFSVGKGNAERLDTAQSFLRRASNKPIAQSVTIDGVTYGYGTILTDQQLQKLDAMDVSSLAVQFNNKVYHLRKFSNFTFKGYGKSLLKDYDDLGLKKGTVLGLPELLILNNSDLEELEVVDNKSVITLTRRKNPEALSLDDLFTAFSIFTDNLNGFDAYDEEYEISNRILVSFTQNASKYVAERMQTIVTEITNKLSINSSDVPLISIISDYKDKIKVNALIDDLFDNDNKQSQMSDITNIVHYAAKSSKATSTLAGNSISTKAISIQNLQLGRFDAFDQPESNKIGVVQCRTMFSELNETGDVMSPYYRIQNGKRVSDEPVYLTAVEESGCYIASFDETFVEIGEDGSERQKTRILARKDGSVLTVDLDQVTLQEYTQLQTMSVAHAMIPLDNMEAGKRITMGCGQGKQAVPLPSAQLPLLGTGVESIIDVGCYYAKDVLKAFADRYVGSSLPGVTIEDIMKSDIKLVNVVTDVEQSKKHLCFRILALGKKPNEFTFDIIFAKPTGEKTAFNYKIVPKKNNVYSPNDVIAINESYELDGPEPALYTDYGGYKPDDAIFKKGIALGVNVTVAFKAFESSNIDDAIVISDRLVFDDTLTNITVITKTFELFESKEEKEVFGGQLKHPISYINSATGLPYPGAIIHPGGIAAIKTVKSSSGETQVKPVFLGNFDHGQVILATQIEKNKKKQAVILLASRTPIEVGDKLAGRHGNKGVVARIVPQADMPYDAETGTIMDVCLNPLGIPSRGNICQLWEVESSEAISRQGKRLAISPYYSDAVEVMLDLIKKEGVKPSILIDGRTGSPFERPIEWGKIYLQKLVHRVEKKIHSIGLDAKVDPVFGQPRKGAKNSGGQAFGEMESWCLQSAGANVVLQYLYSVMSDDAVGRDDFKQELITNYNNVELPDSGSITNSEIMLAFSRSIGTNVITTDDGYQFEPLTDKIIKSFSLSPVTVDTLHDTAIFGKVTNAFEKQEAKNRWSWIDLHTKMFFPSTIRNGFIWGMIMYDNPTERNPISTISEQILKLLFAGQLHVDTANYSGGIIRFYRSNNTSNSADSRLKIEKFDSITVNPNGEYVTGIAAAVWILENYNLQTTITIYEQRIARLKEKQQEKIEDKQEFFNNDDQLDDSEDVDMSLLEYTKKLRVIQDFCNSNFSLKDYVITAFPVMPQTFRPEMKGAGLNSIPDFDFHYKCILDAADRVKSNPDDLTAQYKLYLALEDFTGYDNPEKSARCAKYQSVLSYFVGKDKDDDHGKMRKANQSKRCFASGRTVIIPAEDSMLKPTEVGLPLAMATVMFEHPLAAYLDSCFGNIKGTKANWLKTYRQLLLAISSNNFREFSKLWSKYRKSVQPDFIEKVPDNPRKAFYLMLEEIIEFLEGNEKKGLIPQVVIAGRQPSLHRLSIRAFYVKVVMTRAAQMNSLTCNGFNADYDGDTMWFCAILAMDARQEALEKLSAGSDFINPKDSSIALKHTQDIVLGCYAATMLEENVLSLVGTKPEITYVRSIDELRFMVDDCDVKTSSVVCYRHTNGFTYLSTAGRILFNALLRDGFTTEKWVNVIGIDGVNPENYRALKYDGIISAKQKGKGYCSLGSITKELYSLYGTDSIKEYQSILEFGFKYNSKIAVSLSTSDFLIDYGRDELLKKGEIIKQRIESDFLAGLMSAEEKEQSIMYLYKNDTDGILKQTSDKLWSALDRNHNLFIIIDSGARGNLSQLMQASGMLGVLQKTKTSDLETPVTSNYSTGLSSYEMHMMSFSSRLGVAEVQNETSTAGYTTKQSVYMDNGFKIVEEDCGKTDWWFDVQWGSRKPEQDVFIPTDEWFNNNLLGKKADLSNKEVATALEGLVDDAGIITEKARKFTEEGFHLLVVFDEKGKKIIHMSNPDSLVGKTLSRDDEQANRELKNFLTGQLEITHKCLPVIEKKHLMSVTTTDGEFQFRYNMAESNRSLLLYREARDLPYMFTVNRHGKTYSTITNKTLDYVENAGLKVIKARVLLDCQSEHGVCAHCYGLRYNTMDFPVVGDFLGTEAAQSTGESSTQLVLDFINAAGNSDQSVASGVALYSGFLKGNIPGGVVNSAQIAQLDGYVKVINMNKNAIVSIVPENTSTCSVCRDCMHRNKIKYCPLTDSDKSSDYEQLCIVPEKLYKRALLVRDGEYVTAGSPLTSAFVFPDRITTLGANTTPAELLRVKQMAWFNNYYKLFCIDNGIPINARHFEILARLQNLLVTVTDANDKSLIGKTIEVSAALKDPSIKFNMSLNKQADVVIHNGGGLTAFSFENVPEIVTRLTQMNYRVNHQNVAPIGRVGVGVNMKTGLLKTIRQPDVIEGVTTETSVEVIDDYEPVFIDYKSGEQSTKQSKLASFDFSSFFGFSTNTSSSNSNATEDTTEETVEETTEDTAEDTAEEIVPTNVIDAASSFENQEETSNVIPIQEDKSTEKINTHKNSNMSIF